MTLAVGLHMLLIKLMLWQPQARDTSEPVIKVFAHVGIVNILWAACSISCNLRKPIDVD